MCIYNGKVPEIKQRRCEIIGVSEHFISGGDNAGMGHSEVDEGTTCLCWGRQVVLKRCAPGCIE